MAPTARMKAEIDPTTGQQTEINEHGPVVTEAERELFREKLLYLARGADICVFDLGGSTRVSRDSLKSQGRNTPFLGEALQGRVKMTIAGGRVVFEDGGQSGR